MFRRGNPVCLKHLSTLQVGRHRLRSRDDEGMLSVGNDHLRDMLSPLSLSKQTHATRAAVTNPLPSNRVAS